MGRVCEEVEGVTFSRELVAAISETTFKQCEVLATDLEQFARYRHLCFRQGWRVRGESSHVQTLIIYWAQCSLLVGHWLKLFTLNTIKIFSLFSPDMQSGRQCQLRMLSCAVEEAPVFMSTSPVRLSD